MGDEKDDYTEEVDYRRRLGIEKGTRRIRKKGKRVKKEKKEKMKRKKDWIKNIKSN